MANNQIGEFKISFKRKASPLVEFKVNSGTTAAKALRYLFDSDTIEWQEEFLILGLDSQNTVIGSYKLSSGGTSFCPVDPKMVFQFALLSNSSALILAHNHPTGSLKPSNADIALTNKIQKGAEVFDIKIIDHLIITKDSHYSFAEDGLL